MITDFNQYEPDQETGICSYCKNECRLKLIDVGIGECEFFGRKGRQVQMIQVSDCCEEDVKCYE
jgi:hypothetical protein